MAADRQSELDALVEKGQRFIAARTAHRMPSTDEGRSFLKGAEVPELLEERDRLIEALVAIRDHGTENGHKCWALHQGDCAEVFQEIARKALASSNNINEGKAEHGE